MKLARFTSDGRTRIGVVVDGGVIELSKILAEPPQTIKELLADARLQEQIAAALPAAVGAVPLSHVRLEAPIPDPQKYLGIGLNYRDHAEEARKAGIPVPKVQVWFNKQVSSITGPFSPIHLPFASDKVDYEAELGVVIGRRGRHVPPSEAPSLIAGYFIANDVTARDWQHASPTWTLGKSFDTHGPIGPWIVTADAIADPHNLDMRLYVNGELRQSANTSLMIHNIYAQIAHLTTVMTLEPGDLLATGTCSGIGAARVPPQFLEVGDVVRVEIDGLGHIENTVIAEPVGSSFREAGKQSAAGEDS
jgi:2-keto-4-pentenoate hydratase/2-oxohepta-3-ene-1,7-dioic acid hydratase in catechol pathway